MYDINNYELLNLRNTETRISHPTRRYDARKRIRDFSPKRRLLKNSRVFRIQYFVCRFTAARRSFVKAKYRSAESYLQSSRVANLVRRRFLLLYSCISWASLKTVYLLIVSLSIYIKPFFTTVFYEIYYYLRI